MVYSPVRSAKWHSLLQEQAFLFLIPLVSPISPFKVGIMQVFLRTV